MDAVAGTHVVDVEVAVDATAVGAVVLDARDPALATTEDLAPATTVIAPHVSCAARRATPSFAATSVLTPHSKASLRSLHLRQ